jgi:hypothetical protein
MTRSTKRTLLIVGLAGAAYVVWKMLEAAKQNPYASSSYFNPQTGGAYYPALLAGGGALMTAATVL